MREKRAPAMRARRRAFYNVKRIDTEDVRVERGKRTGTQSLGRAILLVRELAARGSFGFSLGDLARRCALDKSTAHRLLAHLKRERMVQQRAIDGHYVAGPLLYELGLAIREHADFVRAAQPALERVARALSAVAFLYLRSDDDYVCAARAGRLGVKALSNEIGTRRPLATSAGGMAILVALDAAERRAVLAHNLDVIGRFGGLPVTAIERMWQQTLAQGMGVNEACTVPGWNGYAVAIRAADARPFAAIMATAEAGALSLCGRPQLRAILEREAALLEAEAAMRFRN
jgi:DNA-binding IclR family transcriptional regulator